MSGPSRIAACPDASILASLIEGTLDQHLRLQVEHHVADCPECPIVIGQVAGFLRRGSKELEFEPLATGIPWRRIAAAVAFAALSIPAAVWQLSLRRDPLRHLKQVAIRSPVRQIEGCLAGFGYQPFDARRTGSVAPIDLAVRAEAARIEEQGGTDARKLHARGVAFLLTGNSDAAASLLSAAARAAPQTPEFWCDLAAARFARGEVHAALSAADKAVALAPNLPASHFNRALALQSMGQPSEAAASYRKVLALDPDSRWRNEIVQRLAALGG
ncbi:MAG TPA: tetratricopeptide repeat protein [Thermoanaerobaculia bacterium]|nr:tetratricopeptide repeat protein [Thermoanaerobaculia bacterium]